MKHLDSDLLSVRSQVLRIDFFPRHSSRVFLSEMARMSPAVGYLEVIQIGPWGSLPTKSTFAIENRSVSEPSLVFEEGQELVQVVFVG
jgi:hypothetical protein